MNTIRTIIDLKNQIGIQYMNSKLPEFIKRRTFKTNMDKLYKMIDKIQIESLSYELLLEYIDILYTNGAMGLNNTGYLHCNSIKNQTDSPKITAVFKYDITECQSDTVVEGLTGNAVIEIMNKENISIVYRMVCNSKVLIKIADPIRTKASPNEDIDTNDIIDPKFPVTIEDKALYVKNQFITTVNKDIRQYLMDSLATEERINI